MKTEENEQIQQAEVVKPLEKRTRKNKADLSKASKSSHNTRRRQQPDSSEQYLLPADIPKSTGNDPIITQGFENELAKAVIRIPHSLLVSQRFVTESIVHVQHQRIKITVQKQLDNISILALNIMEGQSMQIENQIKNEQGNEINVDKSQEVNMQEMYDFVIAINLFGKYVYLSGYESQNKLIKKVRKDLSSYDPYEITKFKIKQPNSDLFVYLNFKLEQKLSDEYNGLVNQGNTCYMNSYLQTLYHIPAFRNLVYEAQIQDQTKFPATLQQLFYNLTKADKPVSPQYLVKSFGWGKRQANVQQDAQQFSCLFFEALQRKLNESAPLKGYKNRTIQALFKGQLNHYIRCAQVGTVIDNTDFRRENFEEFIDLQLPIYPTLKESLDAYTSEAHMGGENKYWTDEHGFQQAYKGVKIAYFPPILMIQLKRFEYDFDLGHNIKILTEFQYEEQFDFSTWSTTGQKQQYELYAVLVHQGARAQSGHYYNFVKQGDVWFKFNDEFVQQVSKEKALNFNFGGFHESLQFDAKQMKVQKKLVQSKTTAYMLVYIKKQFKQSLFTDENLLPEWILKKNQSKMQQEQIRKNKKNFFHNIGFIDWQTKLIKKKCPEMGFLDEQVLRSKRIIEKVHKQANILQWLNSQNIVQFSPQQKKKKTKKTPKLMPKSDEQKNNDFGLLLYYKTPQREILMSFNVKQSHKVQDFLKLSPEPNPIIIKVPFYIRKDEYLVVVKRFLVQKKGQQAKLSFTFENLISVRKDGKFSDLLQLLREKLLKNSQKISQKDQQNGNSQLRKKFYIDDEKLGPIEILDNQNILPQAVPGKNQLMVCVLQDLACNLSQEERQIFQFIKWYKNKKNTINLIVAQSNTSQEQIIKDIHFDLSLKELRALIFQKILKEKENDYRSAQNIVLKAKIKKNSKYFTQVSQPQFTTLRQLTKFESKIEYQFSSLTVDSRLSQHVLQFYYRKRNTELSEPIKIILNKNEESQTIVKMIKGHKLILEMLNQEGFKEDQSQLMIFTKDWLVINDIVTNQGKVIGRGDFNNYLKNTKNPILIVEGRITFQLQNEPQIQLKEQESDPFVYILLHHVSQSIERVGVPKLLKVDRRMELHEFKQTILEIIKDEVFGWEGKIYTCNPFKTRIYLYGKDNKKVIDLTDLQSFEQMKRLRIEERTNYVESKRKKSKEIPNSPRKQNTIKDGKQSQIQEMDKFQIEKSIKMDNKNGDQMKEQNAQVINVDEQKPLQMQEKEKDEKKSQIGQNEEENLNEGQVTRIEGPETIYGVFPKLKILKVQIVHNYLIKPNITLRLNVDF